MVKTTSKRIPDHVLEMNGRDRKRWAREHLPGWLPHIQNPGRKAQDALILARGYCVRQSACCALIARPGQSLCAPCAKSNAERAQARAATRRAARVNISESKVLGFTVGRDDLYDPGPVEGTRRPASHVKGAHHKLHAETNVLKEGDELATANASCWKVATDAMKICVRRDLFGLGDGRVVYDGEVDDIFRAFITEKFGVEIISSIPLLPLSDPESPRSPLVE